MKKDSLSLNNMRILQSVGLIGMEEELRKDGQLQREAQNLSRSLDFFSNECNKYNIPKLGQSESEEVHVEKLQEYEASLHKFMKEWKAETMKKRHGGHMTFGEWMRLVDQSCFSGRQIFCRMKTTAMELGLELSKLLVDFLLVVSNTADKAAERLQLIETTFAYLALEESSIFLDKFFDVLVSADKRIRVEKLVPDEGKGKKIKQCGSDDFLRPSEINVIRLIFRGIFCLEVAFCFPKISNVSHYAVLLQQGSRIRKAFEEEFGVIRMEIDGLKFEVGANQDLCKKRKMLFQEISGIWNKLNLHPKTVFPC